MLYFRIVFLAFMLLFIIYYVLVLGQLSGLWKVTKADVEIEFNKLFIPFYYFTKL